MKAWCIFYLLTTVSASAFPCVDNQRCESCDEAGKCTVDCYPGFYGHRCIFNCSSGCNDNKCSLDDETGAEQCVNGCKIGFYGKNCILRCLPSEGCQKCPKDCQTGYCQLETRCVSGCEDSYYGSNCTACEPGCEQCDRITGTCHNCSRPGCSPHNDTAESAFFLEGPILYYIIGGSGGFVLVVILLVCFCCYRRVSSTGSSFAWSGPEAESAMLRYYLPPYEDVKKDERGITPTGNQKRPDAYTDVYDAVDDGDYPRL